MYDNAGRWEYACKSTPDDIRHRETSEQEAARKVCESNSRTYFSPIRDDTLESQYYDDGRLVGIACGHRDEETNDWNMATRTSIYDPEVKKPHRSSSHENYGYADATWTRNRRSPDETRPIVIRARSGSDVAVPANQGSGGELCRWVGHTVVAIRRDTHHYIKCYQFAQSHLMKGCPIVCVSFRFLVTVI